jgi:hypothetical protein
MCILIQPPAEDLLHELVRASLLRDPHVVVVGARNNLCAEAPDQPAQLMGSLWALPLRINHYGKRRA